MQAGEQAGVSTLNGARMRPCLITAVVLPRVGCVARQAEPHSDLNDFHLLSTEIPSLACCARRCATLGFAAIGLAVLWLDARELV